MTLVYDSGKRFLRAIYNTRIRGPAILEEHEYFPAASAFRQEWAAIRDEAMEVATVIHNVPRFHEVMSQQQYISDYDGRDWRMYLIRAYGADLPEAFSQCPTMARLLRAHPEVTSATFSFMEPHKFVPTHTGPFRGVVRYYLGLYIPRHESGSPAACLTLDGNDLRVGDGEDLLWDDTYPHSVLNESEKLRVVLLLDVYRQNMPWDMRILSRSIVWTVGLMIRLRRLFTGR